MKPFWQKTRIEETLTNEPDQLQIDRGTAYSFYEDLMKRDPKRAAKLLRQWQQEQENQHHG
jgi:hypothetical protein